MLCVNNAWMSICEYIHSLELSRIFSTYKAVYRYQTVDTNKSEYEP